MAQKDLGKVGRSVVLGILTFSMIAILSNNAQAGDAAFKSDDVRIIARILELMKPRPQQPVTVVIVYDPATVDGKKAAQSISSYFENYTSKRARFLSLLVPKDAEIDPANTDIVFYTGALEKGLERLSTLLAGRQTLTISTSKDCILAGHCVLAITDDPYQNIWYSRRASSKAGLQFSSALLMLAGRL